MQTDSGDPLDVLYGRQLCHCKRDISAKKLTTFAIGGDLRLLAEPGSASEVAAVLQFANGNQLPVRFLGAGSNVLVPDAGVSDLVVKAGRGLRSVDQVADDIFEVGAAMSLMTLSRSLSQQGYAGLEFAGGIPASIGGAVRMNAGAHGGEMAEITEEVQVVLSNGSVHWLPASEFRFSYRQAAVPAGAMITAARIRLRPDSASATAARRAAHLAERKARQPLTLPSAGSVFKNPSASCSAGFLIEKAGLRGYRIGGASISEMHGNWIVNTERSASAQDVLDLIELCQREVAAKAGEQLEPEVVRW